MRLVLRQSFQVQRSGRYAPYIMHSGYDVERFESLLRLASDAVEARDFLGARDYVAAGLDVLLEEEKQPRNLVASLEDLMVFLEGLAQGKVGADRGLAAWFKLTHWWRAKNSLGAPMGSGVEKFTWGHAAFCMLFIGINVVGAIIAYGTRSVFPVLGLFNLYFVIFASAAYLSTYVKRYLLWGASGILGYFIWSAIPQEMSGIRYTMCAGAFVGGLACFGIVYERVFRKSNSFGAMGRIWVRQVSKKRFDVVVENEFFEVVDRFTITKFKAFFEPIMAFSLTADLDTVTCMNGDLCDDSWFQIYPALTANRVKGWGRNLVPKDWKDSYETSQGMDEVDFEKYFSTLDVSLIPPGVESNPRLAYSAYADDAKPKHKQ
ncbi:hypothetical protein [Arcanobacterium bovis]|uniref:Uncharacterized protein n=1 Tax=Arcanobacterium bovis TaxID=2529275 RepID=A0A4Q9V2R8_9ACTO|nr:hypothetical protein [Arcanobacterium bovis]TBW22868.1 hypothetical protein EZJ44_02935 [Arcanobacterium bovis]